MTRPTDAYDQAALDAASREVHMMLLREGSSWGTKACEEMGRVFMTAYRKASPSERQPSVCNQWCGKRHCEPPNYCFYAGGQRQESNNESNAAGQAGSDSATTAPSQEGLGSGPAPAAPVEAPTPKVGDEFCHGCGRHALGIEPCNLSGCPWKLLDAALSRERLANMRADQAEEALDDALSQIAEAGNLLHDNLHTGGQSGETLRSIVERAILSYKAAQEVANRETLSASYWKAKADALPSAISNSERNKIIEQCARICEKPRIWDAARGIVNVVAQCREAAEEIRSLASTAKREGE